MTFRRTRLRAFVCAAASAVVLAACSGGEAPQTSAPAETAAGDARQLASVDAADLLLPNYFAESEIVDPGWDLPVQFADDVYLSASAAEETLTFSAVDSSGTVLWTAERPVSCTGFAISRDGEGAPIAVLTDAHTDDDALSAVTASAYDLHTGAHVWGPVDVPGPHQGPGLVFAAPPAGFMGDAGEASTLDPSTGEVIESPSGRVVGEYDGVVLRADGEDLVAGSADGGELWRTALDELGGDAERIGTTPPPAEVDGFAFVTTGDAGGALVDLEDGSVLAADVSDAALDPATDTLVVVGAGAMRSFDADGDLLWEATTGEEVSITAAGGVLAYLRDDGTVRVHNVDTGALAQGYDAAGEGTIAVPIHFTVDGAGLLHDGDRVLLAARPSSAG